MNEFYSFPDLVYFWKLHRRSFVKRAALFTLVFLALLSLRPRVYESTATFFDGGAQKSGLFAKGALKALGGGEESLALVEFRSHQMLAPVAKKWGVKVGKVKKALKVKSLEENSAVLSLKFTHKDPAVAKGFLDDLLTRYQAKMRNESERQLGYLAKKQSHALDSYDDSFLDLGATPASEELRILNQLRLAHVKNLQKIDRQIHEESIQIGDLRRRREGLGGEDFFHTLGARSRPTFYTDFAGIDLSSAERLTRHYSEKRDQLQLRARQFLVAEKKRDYSLLSGDGVKRAAELSEKIKDEANYSERDRRRFEEELKRLDETLLTRLSEERERVMREISLVETKLSALQFKTYELLGHEIDIVTKEELERKEKLKGEREEIMAKLEEIEERKKSLPELLLTEKKLDLQQKIVEGLTQFIESKHLEQSMRHLTAKVIDPPRLPKSPKPRLLLPIGFVLFFFVLFALYVLKLLRRGSIAASPETLRLSGANVFCGAREMHRLRQFLEGSPSVHFFLLKGENIAEKLFGSFQKENHRIRLKGESNSGSALATRSPLREVGAGRVVICVTDETVDELRPFFNPRTAFFYTNKASAVSS